MARSAANAPPSSGGNALSVDVSADADGRPGPFLCLVGPTGVGKTELSLDLAEALGAEIVSADSRQVYEELTIGTAKPSSAARERVPHHLIGKRTLHEPFDAGTFADAANRRIQGILQRGRVPLVVGGSTLYIHALQEGLADIPDVDDAVRERLNERLEEEGPESLYDELQEVDPRQAEKVDPTKTQRVIRALEVYHGTGKPLTYYHDHQPTPPFRFVTVVLNRDRENLYDRINERVDRMLERGLLDEVRDVMDLDEIQLDEPPLSTIGYREPIRHLRGGIDRDEMIRLVKRNTRRYAKRQLTWFRRYDDYEWMDAASTGPSEVIRMYQNLAVQ
jgi:tRNA dimethylallyltransferase